MKAIWRRKIIIKEAGLIDNGDRYSCDERYKIEDKDNERAKQKIENFMWEFILK